jgi:hypothetical protein
MSGRMSLEQAKIIKEKRELAQELEDVQAFHAATTRSKPAVASEAEEDEESEEELPAKRKVRSRSACIPRYLRHFRRTPVVASWLFWGIRATRTEASCSPICPHVYDIEFKG